MDRANTASRTLLHQKLVEEKANISFRRMDHWVVYTA